MPPETAERIENRVSASQLTVKFTKRRYCVSLAGSYGAAYYPDLYEPLLLFNGILTDPFWLPSYYTHNTML